MKVCLEIPEYSTENGFKFKWVNGFNIKTNIENGSIHIIANDKGLESLANHLLNLAQKNIPSRYHIHLDDYNSLDNGSVELIIEKE